MGDAHDHDHPNCAICSSRMSLIHCRLLCRASVKIHMLSVLSHSATTFREGQDFISFSTRAPQGRTTYPTASESTFIAASIYQDDHVQRPDQVPPDRSKGRRLTLSSTFAMLIHPTTVFHPTTRDLGTSKCEMICISLQLSEPPLPPTKVSGRERLIKKQTVDIRPGFCHTNLADYCLHHHGPGIEPK